MKEVIEALLGFRNSCGHACRGIGFAIHSQKNLRVHLAFVAAALAAAVVLKFNAIRLVLLILTITSVIVAELINTALEFAMDLVEARHHPAVKTAKDVAAGGVLVAVAGSVIIGLLLFGPSLWALLRSCRG
ncbi:MAG: diacylglycerol kinase family protein [Candidatus Omnitrophota bacterium]|nr:diacylglycerol kinase family protein [Candidatus Omnitrophota bacterium]